MCTAATYQTKDFYFGRTLDYEFSYGEEIVITPRNYEFNFRHMGQAEEHYAIIGMAHVAGDYPLYYDAINEKGIGMAGLNFVGNAVYAEVTEGKENVASFEFIPWVLRQCATMDEVRALLAKMNLVGTPFAEQFPAYSFIGSSQTKMKRLRWKRWRMVCICTRIRWAFLRTIHHLHSRCLCSTTISVSPRSSRRILLQKMFRLAPTAAEWVRWDFREIFLPLPGLRAWRSRG